MSLAKAACPDNTLDQGTYISGFLQAAEMIYDWDYEEVAHLAEIGNLRPFSFSDFVDPDDLPAGVEEGYCDEEECVCYPGK